MWPTSKEAPPRAKVALSARSEGGAPSIGWQLQAAPTCAPASMVLKHGGGILHALNVPLLAGGLSACVFLKTGAVVLHLHAGPAPGVRLGSLDSWREQL